MNPQMSVCCERKRRFVQTLALPQAAKIPEGELVVGFRDHNQMIEAGEMVHRVGGDSQPQVDQVFLLAASCC